MRVPAFAVVGHPNKGKSSIVSTLARDDAVPVSPLPGTTTACRRYPMTVDDSPLYELVDTPGFQRARKALEWLLDHETDAAAHPDAVRAFLSAHEDDTLFLAECELLAPIMEGAGILYVVDGSVPFGREYEPEMEILRWTGQPRMALINPIGRADHVDAWRAALGQFFGVVRVFDAVTADFPRQVELLRAFGQLREAWREPLEIAVRSLTADRERRRARSAAVVAETIGEMITHRVERTIGAADEAAEAEEALRKRYREDLQSFEGRSRDRIEAVYDFHDVRRVEAGLELLDRDSLFSKEAWKIFGLGARQIATFGAVGGGTAGALIDAAVGGASFLAGALVGAGVGAVAALIAADRLVDVRVLNVALGRKTLVVGPTTNVNLPHVVFERARLHHALVAGRAHARRGDLEIRGLAREVAPPIPDRDKRALEAIFRRIRRGGDFVRETEELARTIEGTLQL